MRRRTQKAEHDHAEDFDDSDVATAAGRTRKHSLSAEFKNARRSQAAGASRGGGQRLADQLVKQGILSRDTIDRLRDELAEDGDTGKGTKNH